MNPKEIALNYEMALSTPNDKATQVAYKSFIIQCKKQFNKIPVKIIWSDADPYKSSKEMFNDIEKGQMKIYIGNSEHPIMTKRENCIFRAVHDYYGHFISKASFSYEGETKAWQNHLKMFYGEARKVLNTETIGQASVYFYGSKPKMYAEQKAFLLDI